MTSLASPSTASGTTIVDIKDSIAPLMYEIDLETFTENIAEALTNQMRSNTAGDNMDATIVLGEAFTNETFIHARWEWLILPLFLATLTGCLLVLSIYATRRQALWKTSAVALLVQKLEGGTE